MNNKFNTIYSNNIWGGSGTGSKFSHSNKWFLKELRNYIDDNNIKYIADLGCGDWEIQVKMTGRTECLIKNIAITQ
jgi:hypothetical protein